MTESMKTKVAAITGAASGIGLECARTLVAEGAKVVLVDRAKDRLARLCAELGPNALPLAMDLLQPLEVSALLPKPVQLNSSGQNKTNS
jgi:ribitol 2-dehydrogenase